MLNIFDGSLLFEITLPAPIESPALFSSKYNCILIGCYNGYLYCININDGKILWHYKTADKIKCKPTLCNDDTVVLGSYDKYVHCIDIKVCIYLHWYRMLANYMLQDGTKIWQTYIKESISSNPIHVENLNSLIICTTFGKCIKLEQNTGNVEWTVSVKYPVFGSPCLIKDKDLSLVICANVNGSLYYINCSNGHVVSIYSTTIILQ